MWGVGGDTTCPGASPTHSSAETRLETRCFSGEGALASSHWMAQQEHPSSHCPRLRSEEAWRHRQDLQAGLSQQPGKGTLHKHRGFPLRLQGQSAKWWCTETAPKASHATFRGSPGASSALPPSPPHTHGPKQGVVEIRAGEWQPLWTKSPPEPLTPGCLPPQLLQSGRITQPAPSLPTATYVQGGGCSGSGDPGGGATSLILAVPPQHTQPPQEEPLPPSIHPKGHSLRGRQGAPGLAQGLLRIPPAETPTPHSPAKAQRQSSPEAPGPQSRRGGAEGRPGSHRSGTGRSRPPKTKAWSRILFPSHPPPTGLPFRGGCPEARGPGHSARGPP